MKTGQKVRDYILEKKIGEGGMGEVWSAVHSVLGRRVAIKVMSPQVAADREFGERFLQEARAQATLQHPRILGVTDFFAEGGVYYLVMPLMEGETLNDRLERAHGPLPQEEALSLARDLLDALDYAHQKGIIHRDVKPANVLIDPQGHACLTDFGIALLVGQQRLTRTGTSLGTPYYMSPEQIRNPRGLDHRADVYSAGCMIYEMLAGRPPFLPTSEDGDIDFELKEAHMYHLPESIRRWNPSIPAALDAVVLRALAKDRDQRYGGCGEFRRALETWDHASGSIPVQPPPPRAPVPPPIIPAPAAPPPVFVPPNPAPTSKVGLFVGLIVAAILVLFIIIAVATQKKDEEPAEETPAATSETTTMETSTSTTTSSMNTDTTEAPAPIPTTTTSSETMSTDATTPESLLRRDLRERLDQEKEGLTKVSDYYASLAAGAHDDLEVRVEEGKTYVISAVCDNDCQDIDLKLYDHLGGTQIAEDTLVNNTPNLEVTVTKSGTLSLHVSMVKCGLPPCFYLAGLFHRPVSPP